MEVDYSTQSEPSDDEVTQVNEIPRTSNDDSRASTVLDLFPERERFRWFILMVK